MLSLRQRRCTATHECKKTLQLNESFDAGHWRCGQWHDATHDGIEHPHWNLYSPSVKVRRQAAPSHRLNFADSGSMDPHLSVEPWMPAVANDSRLGTMGVPLLACTTTTAATAVWATCRRPNSPRGVACSQPTPHNQIHQLRFNPRTLVLLCHKRSFALALPQQGHCPRRAINS